MGNNTLLSFFCAVAGEVTAVLVVAVVVMRMRAGGLFVCLFGAWGAWLVRATWFAGVYQRFKDKPSV